MTATDRRLLNHIFELWFYHPPWANDFNPPAPGYCHFVIFTDDEIMQKKKEHEDG